MTPARLMDFVREGMRSILRHKLRSVLTLLGIVFGIAAVITMMGIGTGAQRSVLEQISGLGLKNIIVTSVRPTYGTEKSSNSYSERLNYGVTYKDARQLEAALSGTGARLNVAHQVKFKIHYGGRPIGSQSLGVDPEYWDFVHAELIRGSLTGDMHELQASKVAVVNRDFLLSMNSMGNGLGEVIKIGIAYFKIVGVVDVPAHSGQQYVYVPYRTAQTVFGDIFIGAEAGENEYSKTEVGQLIVQAPDEDTVKATAAVVRSTLDRNHHFDDYSVSVPLNILESKQQTQRIMNLVLVTIAAISLIVGGIGIMNIMLASVTERIPEIGIRRAVGATQEDILYQFLAETTTLTLTGGLIGCLAGLVIVPIASHFTGWAGVITPMAIFLSLFVSIVVGIVFGIAPAINAAKMDPGTALRYE